MNSLKRMEKNKKSISIAKLKKKLWDSFSRHYRLKNADLDGNCVCYTCGAVKNWKQMQAGHFDSRRHSNTFIDEDNIRIQCVSCNVFLNGNYQAFARKLVAEKGLGILEDLHIRAVQPFKWDRIEMSEQIKTFRIKAKTEAGRLGIKI